MQQICLIYVNKFKRTNNVKSVQFENIIGEYRAWFDKNNIALPEKGFRQSDDYRTIRLDGIKYYPTAKQSEIIKLLHKNHLNDTSDISQHTIITSLEGDEKETSYKRLRDFFNTDEHSKEIYKVFIIKGERKDTFRLNIQFKFFHSSHVASHVASPYC